MSQCREYTGPRDRNGYGRPVIAGKQVVLTRWIVEQIEGPLLPGEIVRHACDNPPGHRYTSETTRIDSRGWRVCRVCRPHNR